MALSPLAQFIQSRIELIVHTGHSIMHADRAEPNVVIKSERVWIDGIPYDQAPSAENTAYHYRREADIYAALGTHPCIAVFLGLVHDSQGIPIALKTRRVAHGDLRRHIQKTSPPPAMGQRLAMAFEFTRGVAHVHSRGVIWGDLSTRNALLDTDQSVRLCDFASSSLVGVYPELGDYTYEPAYRPALPDAEVDALPVMQRELYALGSAIYEMTEWARPYAGCPETGERNIWAVVESGEMPEISEGNPAREVILKCWGNDYTSAQEVADDLTHLLQRPEQMSALQNGDT